MPSKLDRHLWSRVNSNKKFINAEEFNDLINEGADPWGSYLDKEGNSSSVLRILSKLNMNPHRHSVIDAWIQAVPHPDAAPSGIPALHQIATYSDKATVEKIIDAGADPLAQWNGLTPLEAFISQSKKALISGSSWEVLIELARASKEDLSLLKIDADIGPHGFMSLALESLFYLEGDEVSFVLSNGTWDLDWREDTPRGHWLNEKLPQILALTQNPSIWTRAGMPWQGVGPDQLNLAQKISGFCHVYDERGNLMLPVKALCEALDQGADFDYKGLAGWSARERIGAVQWSDQGEDTEPLMSRLAAQQLQKKTPSISRAPSSRRI